ncbi:hypothetical protein BC835DRAFT_1408851 [Cytidiella melzeri]|nr:hypothetical protein BC835DRAFT_1408851 [Cytidiella melzeri]
MPYSRAMLVAVQGIAYQLAATPPNKTPQNARFDASHPWYIRIAPAVMKTQAPIIWLCAIVELAIAASPPLSSSLSTPTTTTLGTPSNLNPILSTLTRLASTIYPTQTTFLGTSLAVTGSLLRLTCFRTLGSMFTFDLTILPKHTLVTSGPYAYVRHPSYTGSLLLYLGIALINLTPGSWLAESGLLGGTGKFGVALRAVGGVTWWCWWFVVGFTRCKAEDDQLHKTFGKEWESYAARVPHWFVPGLY